MAITSLLPLNFNPITTRHRFSFHSHFPCRSPHFCNKKREFPLPSVASIPYQPSNVEYLEKEFSGHGATFESVGDNCIANLGLQNGSTAKLMLPSGLITSYKPRMWHGGTLEVLHTSVSEGEDGDAVIKGGVSSAFNFENEDEISWSQSTWALQDIRGNSQDSIQVEMVSADPTKMVEVRYILSLKEDALFLELVVSNSKSSSIQLTGSIISHLTVSTPEATYAYGLEGSNFLSRPMFLSNFSIVPPHIGQENVIGLGQLLDNVEMKGFFPGWDARNQKNTDKAKSRQIKVEEEMEGEEDDNHKNLIDQMSRIYTSAPRNFTFIDRGRRNSVVIGRDGFDELYIFSPGSSYEFYGTYSYICVGQSAMLKPVILNPGDVWTARQRLHNPNLE